MDTATVVALGTLVVNSLLVLAGLYFKDKADERRHSETKGLANKAAVSAVVAADEAVNARTEMANKLEVIRADVNSKTDKAIAMAEAKGVLAGKVEVLTGEPQQVIVAGAVVPVPVKVVTGEEGKA